MPVVPEPTPNPNAMKFSVGVPVGGPATFPAGTETDHPAAARLLGLDGVVSVFMTADFVTLTKSVDADWDDIMPAAEQILGDHFLADE